MHGIANFLSSLTMVLGVSAVTSIIFSKLRQPVILGYLLAGMIVGPYTPIPLIADSNVVQTLSELGVILLMFSLGLEFSIRTLFKALPTAGLVALLQCGFMLWLGYVAGRAFGWTTIESMYAGAIIAISSTTIIVKAFSEVGIRDKITRLVFAILIVQDLIAVLLMAGLPALTLQSDTSSWVVAKAAGTLFMFLVLLLGAGIILVPRIMRMVLHMNRPEMTLVVSIGICFSMSLLAREVGYSVALGAFIAGSLMAESGDKGYLSTLIRPVRDMFAAVFFVSVGMLIDPSVMGEHWVPIMVFTILVIAGNFLGVTVGAFLAGYGTPLSIRAAMSLAQIGEFSFIIAGIGITTGATRNFLYPLAVAVSAITTLTTPWFIKHSEVAAQQVDRFMPLRLHTFATLYETWIQKLRRPQTAPQRSRLKRLFLMLFADILIVTGLLISTSLSMDALTAQMASWFSFPETWAQGIGISAAAILILPFCIGIVRCIRALGFELSTRVLPSQETGKLDLARAPRRVLVVTLQLAIVLIVGVPLVAITQPFVPYYYGAILLVAILTILGIVFWRGTTQLDGHVRAGAEMVIEMINTTIEKQREIPVIQLEQFLPGLGPVFSIRVHPGSRMIGRSLTELNLRALTGASVIAITRGKQGIAVPAGTERLQEGDVLAITGTDEAIHLLKTMLM